MFSCIKTSRSENIGSFKGFESFKCLDVCETSNDKRAVMQMSIQIKQGPVSSIKIFEFVSNEDIVILMRFLS